MQCCDTLTAEAPGTIQQVCLKAERTPELLLGVVVGGRGGGFSAPQQTVDPLQLALRQDQPVDLLLPAGTRHQDPAHQHRVGLLLLLGLWDRVSGWVGVRSSETLTDWPKRDGRALTFTNKVEGKVAKSDEARAPRCWLTMCSATSSCREEGRVERSADGGEQPLAPGITGDYLQSGQGVAQGL